MKFTKFTSDGHIAPILNIHLEKGNVLRTIERDGGQSSFSDHVILNVFWRDRHGTKLASHEVLAIRDKMYVVLARPYACVSGAGTCCPTVLTGVEEYEVDAERLTAADSRYRVVLQSTGEAASYTT